jgi:hypothetical protein
MGDLAMNHRNELRGARGLVLVWVAGGLALSSGGCTAAAALNNAVNDVAGAASGCSEFPSSVDTLSLDSNTTAFLTAGASVVNLASSMEMSVYTACVNIASGLGVTDTWSSMSGLDNQTKEACNQASAAITAALDADASAQAACGLSISGGECQVSASAEATCQASCTGSASCTPPDVSADCDPGSLSVQCAGTCNASAVCEGSATVEAQCQGSCQAQCSGECDGTASATVQCNGTCMGHCSGTCGGTATTGGSAGETCSGTCVGQCDAACTLTGSASVHCTGVCKGTCNGDCTITASGGISCGAMATCRGGCTGTATAPTCEGKLTPPACNGNANCQGSCETSAEATATCTPPAVTLACDSSVSGSLMTLSTLVQTNMPPLIAALQTQGPLVVTGLGQLGTTGAAIAQNAGMLTGKAIACAATATSAAANATVSVNVTVQASASVSTSAGGPGAPNP